MFLMIQVDLPSSQEEVWVWLLESSELERIQDCFRFSKAVAFCCFVKGIEKELPTIIRAVERALYPSAPQGSGTVVNQSTDSRDMRVNNAIQVQELHVRDEGDVQGVADALYQLVRRDQKMIGAR